MAGQDDPSGWSLDNYRDYLLLLARLHLGPRLQAKLDPSDLVQETLLKAHQQRQAFRGQTEQEWAAFLRRILANTLADAARHFGRDKRNVGREQPIGIDLEQSSARLEAWLAAEQSSPSERVQRQELLLRLGTAMAQLPEDQRIAVMMRYLQQPASPVIEIAATLERTPKAVSGLIARGLTRLRQFLSKAE